MGDKFFFCLVVKNSRPRKFDIWRFFLFLTEVFFSFPGWEKNALLLLCRRATSPGWARIEPLPFILKHPQIVLTCSVGQQFKLNWKSQVRFLLKSDKLRSQALIKLRIKNPNDCVFLSEAHFNFQITVFQNVISVTCNFFKT